MAVQQYFFAGQAAPTESIYGVKATIRTPPSMPTLYADPNGNPSYVCTWVMATDNDTDDKWVQAGWEVDRGITMVRAFSQGWDPDIGLYDFSWHGGALGWNSTSVYEVKYLSQSGGLQTWTTRFFNGQYVQNYTLHLPVPAALQACSESNVATNQCFGSFYPLQYKASSAGSYVNWPSAYWVQDYLHDGQYFTVVSYPAYPWYKYSTHANGM
jgi:hypothetical protein